MIYASAGERQDGQGGATPEMMQIDPRLQRRPSEKLFAKRYASCFKGTPLLTMLNALGVDTVIVVCVSASASLSAFATVSVSVSASVPVPVPVSVAVFVGRRVDQPLHLCNVPRRVRVVSSGRAARSCWRALPNHAHGQLAGHRHRPWRCDADPRCCEPPGQLGSNSQAVRH